jgi:hypothetical protein
MISKGCSPIVTCLIARGEPTFEQWKEIISSAIGVFSADFGKRSLPTLCQAADGTRGIFCHHKELVGKWKFDPGDEGQIRGLFFPLSWDIRKLAEWTIIPNVAWGVSLDGEILLIELILGEGGTKFWYNHSKINIDQLIVQSQISPRYILSTLRNDAVSRVLALESRLGEAQWCQDSLDRAWEVVSVATAPPAEKG